MDRSVKLLFGILFLAAAGCSDPDKGEDDLFELKNSGETGVQFVNELSERPTPHRTEILYEYFSNGGGVAVGDVNSDGLDDIYLTGNMRFNALYLNTGNLRFNDVTREAGVAGRRNTWNTGVSMADVNGDGLIDIYLCYSGELPLDRRIDELYINQGNNEDGIPVFEEQAEKYGLANPHSSNQAYFFDYDRDGDLDLFLQTHNVKTLPTRTNRRNGNTIAEVDSVNGNRFYENRNDVFVDVTGEVGIESSSLTYGLGALITDVNKDGWPDIYVGNDYTPPDYLYMNNKGKKFVNTIDESMGHISRSSMGVDGADINNDGLTDIVVLDMLPEENRRRKLLYSPNEREYFNALVESGSHYQYTQNTLQLNNGNNTFSEIANIAGISDTDWSWSALIADFDNDGWKDLYVTNGLLHDITNIEFLVMKQNYTRRKNFDLEPNDIAFLMQSMPSTDLRNYTFKNVGGIEFKNVSEEWNMNMPYNSNGAAYSDLDNDGDTDIITNNINEEASIFENRSSDRPGNNYLNIKLDGEGGNTYGIGSKVDLYTAGMRQHLEQFPARGYLSSVSFTLHFGLGREDHADSLFITWPDGRMQSLENVTANQTITLRQDNARNREPGAITAVPLFAEVDAPLDFRHQLADDVDDFLRNPMLVTPQSYSGPALDTSDVNGDGRADLFVGGGSGQAGMLYLRQPDGRLAAHPQPAFNRDSASNDVEAIFFDANGDDHPDLYVASGGYDHFSTYDTALQDRLYINDGEGNFSHSPDALPQNRTSTGAVASADINNDGAYDLFVGGRVIPGQYPMPPRSYVLVNDGKGRFEDHTNEIATELASIGMVTDAVWLNLNGDKTEELIIVGEWMPLTIFSDDGGRLTNVTDRYLEDEHLGLWNTIHIDDLNQDGRPDLIAGNMGLNTQLRASRSEPAELYYSDFDKDGSVDHILTTYVQGKKHPFATLNRLRNEIFTIGSRFRNYEAYAEATIENLLTERELESAERLKVNTLKTSLFIMGENGRLKAEELPPEAQFSPVFAVESVDYNGDGNKDLILAGNMNEARIRIGKQDANYGMLFEGNGRGDFRYIPQHTSGFSLRGDVRAIVQLDETLLFGISRDAFRAYQRFRGNDSVETDELRSPAGSATLRRLPR
ncbi:MAG: VCBS repeat-containing protein [Balneolaceae bacterium]|nr:VCBS repeat-containing protein [Balneolaceae bacterium]